MLLQKIYSFLSGQWYVSSEDELHDIRPYHQGDAKRSINRKKSAKYDTLMTNVYEPDIHIHGHIIQVATSNWNNGITESFSHQVKSLVQSLQQKTQPNTQSSITTTIINQPPKKSMYSLHKTIVISDFLWSDDEISHFTHMCNTWHVRWIILPLLTPWWIFDHPLLKKYPDYFWILE